MKRKSIITLAAIFGVFLLLDTSLLAQSTDVLVVPDIDMEEIEALEHIEHMDYNFAYSTSSSEKNSRLTLSKRYDGESASKTGSFSVDKGVKKIRLSIHGSVKSGKITLELYIPGEKELKKLTIDDSADIQWSQSINVKEGETKYYGEWTYVINVQNAKGLYSLSLSTY
ncbi:hypothetical protein ACFLTU_03115 [Bacteroidota bacterium]